MAFPAVGDPGTNTVAPPNDHASKLLAALANGMDSNGNLVSTYVKLGTNPASAGLVRLANAGWIASRNQANGADVNMLRVNTNNRLEFGAAVDDIKTRKPLYDIRAFGAIPGAGNNNATAIQAAIDAAKVDGGKVLIPGDGFYEFGSQLLVDATCEITGDSNGGYHFDVNHNQLKGSQLRWTGGGSAAILIRPSSSVLNRPVVGVVLRNLTIDGNNAATIGLRLEAALNCTFENIAIRDCTSQCIWAGGTTLGSYIALNMTAGCNFTNLFLSQRSGSGEGIHLDGTATTSNTGNTFTNVQIAHLNGTALNIVRGDHNRFFNFGTSRGGGGTGKAIEFGAVASGFSVNGNVFTAVYADSEVKSYGTATNTIPAVSNVLYGYSLADNATIPTVDTGSSLYWSTWNGQFNFKGHPGPLTIGGTPGAADVLVAGTLLEIQCPNANTDPAAYIGHTTNNKLYGFRVRNGSGQLKIAIAGVGGDIVSGTNAGDGVLAMSGSQTLHLGGGTSAVKVVSVKGDGTLGFFGVTPVARSAAYTATNVTTDRSYDANATTLDEVADVLGTLITDLKAVGLIG